MTGSGVVGQARHAATFDLSVLVANQKPAGTLHLVAKAGSFSSSVVISFRLSGVSARWTGTGTWNGRAGYRFVATAVDGQSPTRRFAVPDGFEGDRTANDRFSVTITDSRRRVVFSTSGILVSGQIVIVRSATPEPDRDIRLVHAL